MFRKNKAFFFPHSDGMLLLGDCTLLATMHLYEMVSWWIIWILWWGFISYYESQLEHVFAF